MEQNVLNTDLTGKVAVVTGASGTLCSIFAKALARAGAKVALLGRNMEKLKALADEIEAEGGIARGYTCNVMNKANCLQVAEDVMAELGPCDILVNGAGGNNARANTDKEYFEMADLEDDTVTFFDLDESGVEMVFDLNFIGTLLPTQAFARQMVGRPGCNILNISSMNAYLPLTKIPAYSGSMSNVHNDNEHSVDRSNRKIAPVFVYPALRVMYSTATPCRVSIVTLDGKEATSDISSTPIKL